MTYAMVLAPLALMTIGSSQPLTDDAARKCPLPVVTAATPKPGVGARKLGEMPDGMLIATVDARMDGCPVMLVLDGGGTGARRGWTPAPGGDMHPAK